ncbi:hypothetical protein NDA17_002436 [Ustilago hordei]|nr:hypothetical protein NDA17_002436 [Ustilago hordei]
MLNHPLVTISPSALAPTPMPSTNQALLAAQPPFAPTQPSGDKLCNPAKAPTSQSAELGVLVNGVHVTIPEPVAVASSSKVFLCLLPDICSFAQAWVVYTLLRCTLHPCCLSLSFWFRQHLRLAPIAPSQLSSGPKGPCSDTAGSPPPRSTTRTTPPMPAPVLRSVTVLAAASCSVLPLRQAPFVSSSRPSFLRRLRPSRLHSRLRLGTAPAPRSLQQTPAQLLSSSLQRTLAQPPTSHSNHLLGLPGTGPPTSVPAALQVPSPNHCLDLLLDSCLHIPPSRPNTSITRNVFDPTSSPTHLGSMQAQLDAWQSLLHAYPNPYYTHQLLGMIQFGCLLGYDGPLCNCNCHTPNLPIDAIVHAHLQHELAARLAKGCLSVVHPKHTLAESPIGVVPKPRSSKLHTIHHLSFPCHPAPNTLPLINSGIDPTFVAIQPAEALHWVIASSLLAAWPLNHYLNDTFGAVLVEVHNLSFLPVHVLALAATALGLHLSAWKTFAGLTCLKILSIEVDSVAQTVGITEDRQEHLLSQCHQLLQHGTADLLDMQ